MVATKCPSPHPCAQLVSVTNNEGKYNLNKNGCTKQSGGWRGGGSRSYFRHGVRAASDSKEALDVLDWSIGQIERGDLLAMLLLR